MRDKIRIRIDSSGRAELVYPLPFPRRPSEIQIIATEYISAANGKYEMVLINPAYYAKFALSAFLPRKFIPDQISSIE